MKHATSEHTTTRQTERASQQDATAGQHAISLAPPAYGIDFVDRELMDTAPVQRSTASSKQTSETPGVPKKNKTGLPDRLKAGVETLSGLSMDDVSVHYNSAKPAQLQALAYTQGTDIHMGPGQEGYLPHEAWHVVQQKQGRVKPTLQMKRIAINDDATLEQEADVMGVRANEVPSIDRKSKLKGQRTERQNEENVSAQTLPIQRRVRKSAKGIEPVEYWSDSRVLHRALFTPAEGDYRENVTEIAILERMIRDPEPYFFKLSKNVVSMMKNHAKIEKYDRDHVVSGGKKKKFRQPRRRAKEVVTAGQEADAIRTFEAPNPRNSIHVATTGFSGIYTEYEGEDLGFTEYISTIIQAIMSNPGVGAALIRKMETPLGEEAVKIFLPLPELSQSARDLLISEAAKDELFEGVRVVIKQPKPYKAPGAIIKHTRGEEKWTEEARQANRERQREKWKKQQAARVIATTSKYSHGLRKEDRDLPGVKSMPQINFFMPPERGEDIVGKVELDPHDEPMLETAGALVSRGHVSGHRDFAYPQPIDVILYHEFVHSLLHRVGWQERFHRYKDSAPRLKIPPDRMADKGDRGDTMEEMMVSGLWYGRVFEWSENRYREEKRDAMSTAEAEGGGEEKVLSGYEERKTYLAVGLEEKPNLEREFVLGDAKDKPLKAQVAEVFRLAGMARPDADYLVGLGPRTKNFDPDPREIVQETVRWEG